MTGVILNPKHTVQTWNLTQGFLSYCPKSLDSNYNSLLYVTFLSHVLKKVVYLFPQVPTATVEDPVWHQKNTDSKDVADCLGIFRSASRLTRPIYCIARVPKPRV